VTNEKSDKAPRMSPMDTTPPYHRDAPLSQREPGRGRSLGDFRFNDFGGLYWLVFNSLKPTVLYLICKFMNNMIILLKNLLGTIYTSLLIKRHFSIIFRLW